MLRKLLVAICIGALLIPQTTAGMDAQVSGVNPPRQPALRQTVFHLRNILGGDLHGLAVKGNIAYFVAGQAFTTADISDFAAPKRLGYLLLPGNGSAYGMPDIKDIVLIGNMAYVLYAGSSLADSPSNTVIKVIDVADASMPTVVRTLAFQLPFYAPIRIIAAEKKAFVIFDTGVVSFDTTNPGAPVQTGQVILRPDTNHPQVTGAAYFADKLYVSDYYGFLVMNVKDPSSMLVLGRYWKELGLSYPEDIMVAGNYAYLLSGGDLHVVSLADPQNMSEVGRWFSGEGAGYSEITISGHYAYVAINSSLNVLDISTPTTPTLAVGKYDEGSIHNGVLSGFALDSQRLYIAWASGRIRAFDVTTPSLASPWPETQANGPISANLTASHGDYLYALSNYFPNFNSVQVIDTHDSVNPKVVGVVPSIPEIEHNGYGYGSCNYFEFCVFNISNPVSPTVLGTISQGYFGQSFVVTGTYAYIRHEESGCTKAGCSTPGNLEVIDVSNPAALTRVNIVTDTLTNRTTTSLAAVGNYLYLQGSNGLRIMSLDNPISPTQISTYTHPGYSCDQPMQIQGIYGYLPCITSLIILDLSNPARPSVLSSVHIGVYQLTIKGSKAYSLDDGTIYVTDISDPHAPRVVSAQPSPFGKLGGYVAVKDDGTVYIGGAGGSNLLILDSQEIDLPFQTFLSTVHQVAP